MTIATFSSYLEILEQTSSRNQMTKILADLFSRASARELGQLTYLIQGRLAPLFTTIEFGMADKMVIRAIAQAYQVEEKIVKQLFKVQGDLGRAARELANKYQKDQVKCQMSVGEVYNALYQVATASGGGSQEKKLTLLAGLLQSVDPLSVCFLVRVPLGKLRLGFSDMTVLDALSFMISGNKKHRQEIERAYNVRPDLGFITKTVKQKGIKGLSLVTPELGTPIRMAQAERMSSAQDILDKIGRCAVEPKIDGFRLQSHYRRGREGKEGESVRLFTRNLEDATFMYPDVVLGIKKQIQADSAIFEGEAVAYDIHTGKYLPFQETVQRKRKYDIEKMAEKVPLKLILFDLLYLNGQNFLKEPYEKRRKSLEEMVAKGEVLLIAQEHTVDDERRLKELFEEAVSRGLEGVMAKRLDGVYQAGARNWNWIKYKRSYAGKLTDTIDSMVMGYDYGQGKRVSFGIGDFLIGIYDKKDDTFKTVAKVGTGLTDEEWQEMRKRCDKIKIKDKPAHYQVDKAMDCDVWVKPNIVVEIIADEITRSPVHTAGRKLKPSKTGAAWEVSIPGFALRFPRLKLFRDDKSPDDATTLSEITKIFKTQGRRKSK